MLTVDLFVDHPIEFEELWRRSEIVELQSTTARIASLSDLIHIKRLAGRTQVLEDVWRLEEIRRLKEQAEP